MEFNKINNKIRVVYFTRRPRNLGNFSLEIYFETVRKNLPDEINPIVCEMPFESNGFFKRFANCIYCLFNQGDVNHVTGDINYVAIFLKKRKTILTVLDCGMLQQTSGVKQFIFKQFWFNLPIRNVKLVTAISQATKDDILNYINCDPEKIKVVYVCVNSNFRESPSTFNKDQPKILQIGTAINKNINRLIDSLIDINCELTIIGKIDNELILKLKSNKINYNLIDWRLSDEEIIQQYLRCDILSFVSTLEGFGMPIVEANITGRVVVTSNISSMPEIAGDAAELVNPFNVESIRNGFLKVIENDEHRESLIKKGLENAKRFDSKKIANEYFDLYRQMALN